MCTLTETILVQNNAVNDVNYVMIITKMEINTEQKNIMQSYVSKCNVFRESPKGQSSTRLINLIPSVSDVIPSNIDRCIFPSLSIYNVCEIMLPNQMQTKKKQKSPELI